MKGSVDENGRAVIRLKVSTAPGMSPVELGVWVDTAFTGELVIPRNIIAAAAFEQSAGIQARLADGSVVTLESYTCVVDWFGAKRAVEVVANDGDFPLLGVGLLVARRLTIDYAKRTVSLV